MADQIKRILIIDDHAGYYFKPEKMVPGFKHDHVDAEIVAVTNREDAINQIDLWYDEGVRANIITSDRQILYPGTFEIRDNGHQLLSSLIRHIKKNYGDGALPDQFFLHSNDRERDFSFSGVDVIAFDTGELRDLEAYGENYTKEGVLKYEGMIPYYTSQAETTVFRKFLNENWGSQYPLSDLAVKARTQGIESFELYEAEKTLEENIYPPEYVLSRLDLRACSTISSYVQLEYPEDEARRQESVCFDSAVEGAASGYLALSTQDVEHLRQCRPGEPIILAVETADPGIIHCLSSVAGLIVLSKADQHLKLIAENNDLPAVIGVSEGCEAKIEGQQFKVTSEHGDSHIFSVGDGISIKSEGWFTVSSNEEDNHTIQTTGQLSVGKANIVVYENNNYDARNILIQASDQIRKDNSGISVFANADSKDQVKQAIRQGAEGVGLIRTENMFHEPKHLEWLQKHFLTRSSQQRAQDLNTLVQLQTEDFVSVLKAAKDAETNFPLTFRLLDAVPGEFLSVADTAQLKRDVGADNLRGVQFARKRDTIYQGQVQALFEAAVQAGYKEPLKIEVPNVRTEEDIEYARNIVERIAAGESYKFGSMIETSGAVQQATVLAGYCDFAMFGTNDLTSDFLGGLTRNDIAAIETWSIENKHWKKSPFLSLAEVIKDAIADSAKKMRAQRPDIELGICGRQVCDDRLSIEFAVTAGLNISVPTRNVPYVKLLAGQIYARQNLKTLKV